MSNGNGRRGLRHISEVVNESLERADLGEKLPANADELTCIERLRGDDGKFIVRLTLKGGGREFKADVPATALSSFPKMRTLLFEGYGVWLLDEPARYEKWGEWVSWRLADGGDA